ncbi:MULTISPECIES: YsnF/AvaK domain-containing protein [unclassified Candidatus Sulfotelmatobacter]|uniref:YsnF/AvaK domain-containing protein n=1 Tax=unclassified Candidatus Sulfotelmatobacter TaxID=2635724 RepID=UPI00168999CD|nr:YsnF/AvaK domain-containing protein [Kocuria sp. cx-116]MBD2763014.1 YsnF/AvaK domain-containing protein [Kocuria sp. cx-116]
MAAQNSVPGQDPRDPQRDEMLDDRAASVVRHEERLVINRQRRETGSLRLRKYVVEEPVRQEVTVGHDEPDVVRTPISDDERQAFLDGHDLSVGDDELILYRTEAVVRTVRVPYQRVRLVAQRAEHTEVIEDTLRKERIDIETDDRRA